MFSSSSEDLEKLQVLGFRCSLFCEPEKNLEINKGALLVPLANNENLLIDRFDCRGYLVDVSEHDSENIARLPLTQTAEDKALEDLCNHERYIELHNDIHEVATLLEEEAKRKEEVTALSYGAVDFSYDAPPEETKLCDAQSELTETVGVCGAETASCSVKNNKDTINDEPENAPYVCPPELILSSSMVMPEFERQAAIIERTAVFIARNNTQMEIVLKTKQAGNPQFKFLNYDDNLNPFYKEMVKLIKTGRYIPRRRPVADGNPFGYNREGSDDQDLNEEDYELKLPKVDISNTAYASLINRFKKAANDKLNQSPNTTSPESSPTTASSSAPAAVEVPATETAQSPAETLAITETTLEQCYQDYYRHYYMHYYVQLTSTGTGDEQWFVAEAARLAVTAASAAVNAMRQSNLAKSAATTLPSSDVRGIIDKMAEYVARNGEEFQEVVKKQKQDDVRFAFLEDGHLFHEYYVKKKHEFITTMCCGRNESDASTDTHVEGAESPAAYEGSTSSKSNPPKSISFRLRKSASSGRLKDPSIPSPVPTDIGCSSGGDDQTPAIVAGMRSSMSCTVLPGMNYYSDSDESDASPPPSQEDSEDGDNETMTRTLSAVLEVASANCPVPRTKSVSPQRPSASALPHRSPSPLATAAPTMSTPFPLVDSSLSITPTPSRSHLTLRQEAIARDIKSMEEEARVQLERRKRAALFAARLQMRRMLTEREEVVPEKNDHEEMRLLNPTSNGASEQRSGTSTIAQSGSSLQKIPPSSVSAALAHDVVAKMKSHRDAEERKHRHDSGSLYTAHPKRSRRSSRGTSPSGSSEDEKVIEHKRRRSHASIERKHHHRRHKHSGKHRESSGR